MKKQFELNALKKQAFRAPVIFDIPTDETDKKGNTVYVKTGFIGHYQKQTEAQQHAMRDKIQAVQEDIDQKRQEAVDAAGETGPSDLALQQIAQVGIDEIKALTKEGMREYFTGFSKHPLYEFPVLINGEVPEPSADIITAFLDESLLSDPIGKAYINVVNKDLKGLLEGNSKS